jgi:hypothetical protein
MTKFYKAELGSLARRSGEAMTPVWWAACLVYVLTPLGLVRFVLPRIFQERFLASSALPTSGNNSGAANYCGRTSTTGAKSMVIAFFTLLSIVMATVFPTLLWAEGAGYPEPSRDIRFSLAVTPTYQFPAHVDGGGKLSVVSYHLRADAKKQINPELGLGLGLTYEFDDYHFSGVTAFPVGVPWKQVQRLGISVPIFYSADKWMLLLVPSAQFSGELGAKFGDALAYGGVVSASYALRPNLNLGVGVGVYSNLEKVSVFPYLAVNWQITDQLRLTNPFRTSPAGPAGLELSYNLNRSWEIGVGGAYRSYRFRLDQNGSIPNGIGESRRVPIFARLSYNLSPAFGADLYGGAAIINKLWLDASNGNDLYSTKYAVAPLVGLTLRARF